VRFPGFFLVRTVALRCSDDFHAARGALRPLPEVLAEAEGAAAGAYQLL
jgi:hypothetical protein